MPEPEPRSRTEGESALPVVGLRSCLTIGSTSGGYSPVEPPSISFQIRCWIVSRCSGIKIITSYFLIFGVLADVLRITYVMFLLINRKFVNLGFSSDRSLLTPRTEHIHHCEYSFLSHGDPWGHHEVLKLQQTSFPVIYIKPSHNPQNQQHSSQEGEKAGTDRWT